MITSTFFFHLAEFSKNKQRPTGGLAKLGLDKLSFNILLLSTLVRADTTSPGYCTQLQNLIKNQHRFRADNWKIPNFAKPRALAEISDQLLCIEKYF